MTADKNSKEKIPSSIVGAQLQRLLEIVESYQQEQCHQFREQAEQQSRQIIQHAYRNARARLRNHILEDRHYLEQELSATRAKRHTFNMQLKHQASQEFLEDSWQLLTSRLIQRWENPKQRGDWIKSVIDNALRSLAGSDWQVSHGDLFSEADKQQIVQLLAGNEAEIKIIFSKVPDVRAGILVTSDSASVDGSVDGLLADRVRIEAKILAQCTNCIVHSQKSHEETEQ